jgi:hypothetical protein
LRRYTEAEMNVENDVYEVIDVGAGAGGRGAGVSAGVAGGGFGAAARRGCTR